MMIDSMSILEQIRSGKDILSMPQVLTELLRQVNNPNFNSDSLSKLILKDPGLTTRILRLANSPFYQRFAKSSTVHQSVQVLGLTTVKCLALSAAIFNPERGSVGNVKSKDLFAHILSVASVSETIARKSGHKASEEAFIAGLLHQIGLMFLLQNYGAEYEKVIKRETSAIRLLEAEQELFGLTRYDIGAEMALHWSLPTYVVDAIRELPNLQREPKQGNVGLYLALAALLTPDPLNRYPVDLEERASRISTLARACKLSQGDIDDILACVMEVTLKAAEHLDVNIGSTEEILARANKEIWRTYLIVEHLFKERQELSRRLLEEERIKGALEQKAVTMATLSHYVNNASMGIYGRSQILRMFAKKGDSATVLSKLPPSLDSIDNAVKKIMAVLAEIRELAPLDHKEFILSSSALNIDDRIEARMKEQENESGLEMPEEAKF
jgi:HD-like signal output (HDOD) protein